MVNSRALIICNGTIRNYEFYRKYFDKAYIICVDGGTRHMKPFKYRPDILIGDFDSTDKEDLQYYIDLDVEIKRFDSHKDKTDTHLAIDLAIRLGYKEIIIIGALGTRLDHSLANIQLLKHIMESGNKGIIVDEYNEIQLINSKVIIKSDLKYNLSLIPLTEIVTGVTSKGLYYPLNNISLKMGDSIGISNEFIAKEAEIAIKSGILILMKSKD